MSEAGISTGPVWIIDSLGSHRDTHQAIEEGHLSCVPLACHTQAHEGGAVDAYLGATTVAVLYG